MGRAAKQNKQAKLTVVRHESLERASWATAMLARLAERLAREAGPKHVARWHLRVLRTRQVAKEHLRREVVLEHALDLNINKNLHAQQKPHAFRESL